MTIHLRTTDFEELAESRGHRTYEQQATATGLGIATMHRLRNGAPADSRSIAKICNTYGANFDTLFIIKTDAVVAA